MILQKYSCTMKDGEETVTGTCWASDTMASIPLILAVVPNATEMNTDRIGEEEHVAEFIKDE